MQKIFTILTVAILFSACTASKKLKKNKDDNSLLWQISGNGLKEPSYLFGTFHLLCKEDVQFSNPLKKAVSNSKEIYMELDMDDPAIMGEGLKLMYMKDGKSLKSFYTDSEYVRLQNYFNDSLQVPLAFMDKMKPYFLVALLYPKMLPCKTTSGVEEQLVQLAKQNKKEIQGLETMEFQASVFDSIPYAEQAKELLKSVDSINTYRNEFDTMLNVYKTQSVSEIEGLFNKSEFGMDEHEDILLDNRNKKWVIKLKEIMKAEPVFVAVGAGHLVGPKRLDFLTSKGGVYRYSFVKQMMELYNIL